MNRILTLLHIALLRPRSATERRLRAVVIIVGIVAVALGGVLFAGKSQLNQATVNQRIETTVSEFRRVAEPVIRRLKSLRTLSLTEGFLVSNVEELPAVRAVAVEPVNQVRGVVWADSAGFAQLHLRSGVPERPWTVIEETNIPFKSRFEPWFTVAIEALDKHGGTDAPVVWTDAPSDFPDATAALIASLAWRVEIDGAERIQVAAFVIEQSAIRTLLDNLDLGDDGAVLTFPVGGKTVLMLMLSDLVSMRSRQELVDQTSSEIGSAAAELLRNPTADKNIHLSINGVRCVGACRQTDLSGERFWIIVALPLSTFAVVTHNGTIVITLLVGLLVLGLATVVHMALRTSQSLERLTSRQRYSEAPIPTIQALIRAGESETVEFKSTLRWNIKADRPGKEISHAVLKSLGAFCNSDGGTLLVGVEDDGRILGIQADRFTSEDKFLLHFNNMLKEHLDLAQAATLAFNIRDVGGQVLVIDCPRITEPVFVRNGDDQEYYVRLGPGTRKLSGLAMIDYMKNRE